MNEDGNKKKQKWQLIHFMFWNHPELYNEADTREAHNA
jgi:hypothetical protein